MGLNISKEGRSSWVGIGRLLNLVHTSTIYFWINENVSEILVTSSTIERKKNTLSMIDLQLDLYDINFVRTSTNLKKLGSIE